MKKNNSNLKKSVNKQTKTPKKNSLSKKNSSKNQVIEVSHIKNFDKITPEETKKMSDDELIEKLRKFLPSEGRRRQFSQPIKEIGEDIELTPLETIIEEETPSSTTNQENTPTTITYDKKNDVYKSTNFYDPENQIKQESIYITDSQSGGFDSVERQREIDQINNPNPFVGPRQEHDPTKISSSIDEHELHRKKEISYHPDR